MKEKEVKKMPEFGGVEGYEDVERVLTLAHDQTARGKGRERHANNRPFNGQPIMEIPKMMEGIAGLGGLVYQIQKKSNEAVGMARRTEFEAAKKELLGAIIYTVAAYLHIEREEGLEGDSLKQLQTREVNHD